MVWYANSHVYADLFSGSLSEEEILEQARKAAHYHTPIQYQTKTTQYVRDNRITMATKKRAAGICQLCGGVPFYDNDGEPYLEVHHIIPLSENGIDALENVVALCPNCHRKVHCLKDQNDIDKLKEKALIHSVS